MASVMRGGPDKSSGGGALARSPNTRAPKTVPWLSWAFPGDALVLNWDEPGAASGDRWGLPEPQESRWAGASLPRGRLVAGARYAAAKGWLEGHGASSGGL